MSVMVFRINLISNTIENFVVGFHDTHFVFSLQGSISLNVKVAIIYKLVTFSTNELTGFYVIATLALNELRRKDVSTTIY